MVVMFNAIYSPSPVAVGTAQGFLLVVLSNFDMFWVLGLLLSLKPTIHQLKRLWCARKRFVQAA